MDTRSRRTIVSWKAHEDGILGLEEWVEASCLLTSGRDNKLNLFELPETLPILGNASSTSSLPSKSSPPKLLYTMDINALNYCRFSLLDIEAEDESMKGKAREKREAWVAVPNLTNSETIDIFHLPSQTRPHAAIGFVSSDPDTSLGRGALDPDKTGLVMFVHLLTPTTILVGTESGHVLFFEYEGRAGDVTDARLDAHAVKSSSLGRKEKSRWVRRWKEKIHREAVMGLAVSPSKDFALSVSADHQVVKYYLDPYCPEGSSRFEIFKINQLGNSSIHINGTGRVCAVAGWDGNVRLFSTKSFKSLGTLSYHRDTCHILSFAHRSSIPTNFNATGVHANLEIDSGTENGSSDEEEDTDESNEGGMRKMNRQALSRDHWLATGGVDKRVAVWELMDFEKRSVNKKSTR
ncbi:G-protein beta subunit-like protein GNB1L, contains WD repeats [Phaffia rhodozyma]|uniref:ASTRA-associated protein 1 n=1 Tax=Phaffia rhodozyma TaxID=264483 RepID=A0A0F7SP15_PHARH|nr:G-protein beta subunit-like protein GNB1L, contains WD repeats [Phaffia rhodozyma]